MNEPPSTDTEEGNPPPVSSVSPDSLRRAAKERDRLPKGPLAWMAGNVVAANLLMAVLIVGGLMMLPRIKKEVFPQFELDLVVVNIAYPGASPAEVEQGVVLAVEEAVRAVDGVKEVRSTAVEGTAAVTIELILGTDANRALADVKSAVDRVTSFPNDIERPIVSLATNKAEVISVVVYGDQEEHILRELAEGIRDDLLQDDEITVVNLAGVRAPEISIEVPQAELRRYNLTLDQIAGRIRAASVELPGGGVKTAGGEILVRTTERRERGSEFEEIVVLSRPDGTEVKLGEIAKVKDGFQDNDREAFFNGKRAAMVKVYRVGDSQGPVEVASVVKKYVEEHRDKMPPGVELSIWGDWSEMYEDRLELMLRNARMGLVLVIIVLGLFLELRLAFWVTLGIPISFIGSLLFLPGWEASINMISLFAFIVTLGIVVDDAIVVGESVYKRRTEGLPPLRAAIEGVREVSTPVIFAVLTTIIAFAPLLFVPGPAGKFFRLIPIVVIAVLVISLVESLLILPAHLAHTGLVPERGFFAFVYRYQQRFSRGVEWFIDHVYRPVLERAVRRRWLTLAICGSLLLASVGLVAGGRVQFTFLPKVDGDVVVAEVELPFGAPVSETRALATKMVQTGRELLEENGGEAAISRGVFSQVGASGSFRGGPDGGPMNFAASHKAEVAVFMVPIDERNISAAEFVRQWREKIGEVPGLESLKFFFSTGPNAGDPINVELAHRDIRVLERAAGQVATRLADYNGVYAIDDGFSAGKEQLDFTIRPQARTLGLTEIEMARQVRAAFFGAEAARQQRGRDELRAYVRLPKEQRASEFDLESLLLRTPRGGEIPLSEAAEVSRGRSYTEIKRRDGRRIVNVTADIDASVANANQVIAGLTKDVLPGVMSSHTGLGYSFQGEQKAQAEVMSSLGNGFALALCAIFALLAVVFRSYIQPLIIMTVIPFGLVGAIFGHVVMGYDLSLMSMMGLVALSGVVVNDSLILIVAVNRFREEGMTPFEAIVGGGVRRFRPILLTSLTTFFGLTPMILETSVQARFMIPMAVSLAFGVLFATFIMLLLVPAVYSVVLDAKHLAQRIRRWFTGGDGGVQEPTVLPGE